MKTKTRKKKFRIIYILISVILLTISITTVYTAVRLRYLSYQHGSVDAWRISEEGSLAANNVQQGVREQRDLIYKSSNPIVRYISNLEDGKQELMTIFFSLPLVAFGRDMYIRIRSQKRRNERRRRARVH